MSMTDWTDQVVGERMAVDSDFAERVLDSEFSNQEWSLIMTAVEFEIENPDDPQQARIVPDTSNLDAIMPELDTIRTQRGGVPGAPGDDQDRSKSGLLEGMKDMLGLGADGTTTDHTERKQAAADLAKEYASALQEHLEEKGRWDEVRTLEVDD